MKHRILLAFFLLFTGLCASGQSTVAERDSLSKLPRFRDAVSYCASVKANSLYTDTSAQGRMARWVLQEQYGAWLATLCRAAAQQSGVTWEPTDAQYQTFVNSNFAALSAIFAGITKGK